MHLDPAGAWTGPRDVLWVLDGATLVEAEPAPDARPHGGNRVRSARPAPASAVPGPCAGCGSAARWTSTGSAARPAAVRGRERAPDPVRALVAGAHLRLPARSARPRGSAAATSRLTAPSSDKPHARHRVHEPCARRSGPRAGRAPRDLDHLRRAHAAGPGHHGAGRRAIQARGLTRPTLDGFGRWDAERRTITYSCVELEPGVRYALPVSARSFRDLLGNGCQELDIEGPAVEVRGRVGVSEHEQRSPL